MLKTTLITLCLFIPGLAAAGGQSAGKKQPGAAPWETRLLEALPALGHRNWIVVADSAYPAQISPGVEIVVSGADHLEVLARVLAALDGQRHVRPRIFLDKELGFLSDDLAPGIEALRTRLDGLLKGRDVSPVLHEELIARLDEVAKTFRVLMIKTDLALPYTSVFMELDCGYWPPESEQKLRLKMR
jgi:L-fucose mutarotase/ribose pyranase (RbsD/FucU family)